MTTVKSAPPPTSIDLATLGIEIASHRGRGAFQIQGGIPTPRCFAAAPPLSDLAVPDVDDTGNHVGAVVFQISSGGTQVAPGAAVNVSIGQQPSRP